MHWNEFPANLPFYLKTYLLVVHDFFPIKHIQTQINQPLTQVLKNDLRGYCTLYPKQLQN